MTARPKASIVLLLGAGFSASADLPTSVKLAELFKAFIIDRANGKGPKTLKLLHFYIEGGIRFQLGKRGLDPSAPLNVEQIAIAARHLLGRERSPLAPFVAGWHPHLVQLLADEPRLLEEYLGCFYEHLHAELGSPVQEKIAYIDGLTRIAANYGGLDIFSLNYDCCVEKALIPCCEAQTNLVLIDGFSASGWNPELFRQEIAGQYPIRLYKMHGSLDWVNSAEWGLMSIPKVPPNLAEEFFGMQPHLIFGTDVKLTSEQPFFSMAHLFYERLSVADLLVVIGYSFADDYVNSIISQSQRQTSKLRLMHVSPHASNGTGEAESARNIRVDKPLDSGAGPLIQNHGLLREIDAMLNKSMTEMPF